MKIFQGDFFADNRKLQVFFDFQYNGFAKAVEEFIISNSFNAEFWEDCKKNF